MRAPGDDLARASGSASARRSGCERDRIMRDGFADAAAGPERPVNGEIAFLRLTSGWTEGQAPRADIFAVEADGGGLRAVVRGLRYPLGKPAWSPDGRELAVLGSVGPGPRVGPDAVYFVDPASGRILRSLPAPSRGGERREPGRHLRHPRGRRGAGARDPGTAGRLLPVVAARARGRGLFPGQDPLSHDRPWRVARDLDRPGSAGERAPVDPVGEWVAPHPGQPRGKRRYSMLPTGGS